MPTLFLIPLVYLAAVLQTWLAPRWQPAGATPNLLVLVAFGWLALKQRDNGLNSMCLVVIALVGLVGDLSSSTSLGLNAAAFALVAYFTLWLDRHFNLRRVPGQLLVVWLAATSITLIDGIALRCLGQSPVSARMIVERTAMIGLYTAIVAAPILIVCAWRNAARRASLAGHG